MELFKGIFLPGILFGVAFASLLGVGWLVDYVPIVGIPLMAIILIASLYFLITFIRVIRDK